MRIQLYKFFTIAAVFTLIFILYRLIADAMPIPAENDIYAHAVIAKNILTGEWSIFSRPFIMYFLAILLSLFSKNIFTILTAICLLLTIATTIRFYISQKEIYRIKVYSDPSKNYIFSTIIGLSLIFIFAIPLFTYLKSGTFYIGNFTPNVWHNSTTIFLMPFTILLYIQACKQIESYNTKRDILILAYIFLNIFIKPSFFFAFVCAYPLMMLLKYKFSKIFFKSLFPLLVGIILLILQYWLMYFINDEDISGEAGSGIGFGFFTVYRISMGLRFLPISILGSLLFPITYSILNFKKLKNSRLYLFSVLLIVFAIFIYATTYETGPRFFHGNFYWQIIPCVWILFFVLIIELSKDIKKHGFTVKNKVLIGIYLIHVISGISYVLRIIIEHIYY